MPTSTKLCDAARRRQHAGASNPATRLDRRCPDGAAFLRYKFDSTRRHADRAAPRLRLPADAKDLHKLIFSFVADNSWHRIDATLEVGERHFKSERTTYLAQARPASIFFQPPGVRGRDVQGEDLGADESRRRTMRPSHRSPRNATLRLIVRPSSTLEAICGKVHLQLRPRVRLRPVLAVRRQQPVARRAVHARHAVQQHVRRLRVRAAALARRAVAFVLLLSTMMLPGAGDDDPVVHDLAIARLVQHAQPAVGARRGSAGRSSSS